MALPVQCVEIYMVHIKKTGCQAQTTALARLLLHGRQKYHEALVFGGDGQCLREVVLL